MYHSRSLVSIQRSSKKLSSWPLRFKTNEDEMILVMILINIDLGVEWGENEADLIQRNYGWG